MILVMLGVFLGNWLIVPLLFHTKHKGIYPNTHIYRADHTKGFFIGVIAALLVWFFYTISGRS